MNQFQRGGLAFPVRDSGPADGEVVVLLPGFPQDESAYDGVVNRLNARGLRTLVPTQRGYGRTAQPSKRRDYRTSELTQDVLALVDAIGRHVHLVGHDWGGGIAWAVAGWRPDLVRSLTVLSTPHPAALTESLWRSSQALRFWYVAFFQLPLLPEIVLSRALGRRLAHTGLPAAAAERYAAMMNDRSRLTGALNWYRGLPFSLRPSIPDITVPTTFVWGWKDFALGRVAAQRTARHIKADYRFLPLHAGHWLPESFPGRVADAILDRIDHAD